MTREEIQDFLAMVQATYPNYNPPSKKVAVNAWTMALEDFDKDEIAMAFKVYIRTNTSGFAPSPGQLIEQIQSITQPQELNEMEAWALVHKAICNSTYNSVEEFSKLPPLVQKAVGLPENLREWAMTENLNHEVVSSNFMRSYKVVIARQQELAKMPSEVRQLIQNATQGSYSAQIEDLRQQTVKSLTEREESEIKALETKSECVPMPDRFKEKMEEWRNDKCGQNTEYE